MTSTETMEKPVATGKTHRRNDVQGLRAIAILLVVAYHAGLPVPGGFVGVDVFFVISGFVISGLLFREADAQGTISLARFYARRVRRLFPALALMSGVTLALSAVLLSPLGTVQPTTGRAASAASAFVANAYFFFGSGGYFQPAAESNPFLHTWSLSVEEQFYLVFPIVLLVGLNLGRRRRNGAIFGILCAIFVVSVLASIAFTYDFLPQLRGLKTFAVHPDLARRFAFYSPLTRAWEFLGGVLITIAGRRHHGHWSIAQFCGGAGAALLGGSALLLHASGPFPGLLAMFPVAGTMLLIYAGQGSTPSFISRTLSSRPMVAVGNLSYSWYLWHWPAIVFAKAWYPTGRAIWLAAALASLLPAIISYRWIELPIHSGRRIAGSRFTAAIAVTCISVPILAGVALTSLSSRNWGSAYISTIAARTRPDHVDIIDGCASTAPLGSPAHPRCVWPVGHAQRTVLLIGDSNAGHLSEPMIDAAHLLGTNLEIATDGGCPFTLNFSARPECTKWARESMTYIAARRPAYTAVVISNDSIRYLSTTNFPGSQRSAAIARWARDLRATVRLAALRSSVAVIGAVPQFYAVPNCLIPSILEQHPTSHCGHLSGAKAVAQRAAIVQSEESALVGTGAAYYDTATRLCNDRTGCSVYVRGQLAYRDGAHLRVAGSLLFANDLRSVLARAIAGNDPSR